MTIHTPHRDSHLYGLADDCARCQEHASHPHLSLDSENLRRLLRGDIYTTTDVVAARRLREVLDEQLEGQMP